MESQAGLEPMQAGSRLSGGSAQHCQLPAGSANHLSPRMEQEAEKELKRPRQKALEHSRLASQRWRLPSWPPGNSSALARNHLAGPCLLPPKGSLDLLVPAQSNVSSFPQGSTGIVEGEFWENAESRSQGLFLSQSLSNNNFM